MGVGIAAAALGASGSSARSRPSGPPGPQRRSAARTVSSPGTLVRTADGGVMPIEGLDTGDWVAASDPATGEVTAQQVIYPITGEGTKHLIEITTTALFEPAGLEQATAPSSTITATAGHPTGPTDQGRGPRSRRPVARTMMRKSRGGDADHSGSLVFMTRVRPTWPELPAPIRVAGRGASRGEGRVVGVGRRRVLARVGVGAHVGGGRETVRQDRRAWSG